MNFPFIYHIYSVKKIMFLVIIACIPGICAKCYFFGSGTLIEILFSVIIAIILEIIVLKIRFKKNTIDVQDNSSILTAVLFGVSIPSLLPWWMIIIGLFFSIVVSKHLYGGIGQNIFNPAMVGYAVLLISFPIHMNNWNERDISLSFLKDVEKSINIIFFKNSTYNFQNQDVKSSVNAITEATPLNNFKIKSFYFKDDFILKNYSYNQSIILQASWKYINISFLLGGIFLILKRIICWRIPISFLISLGVLSFITYCYSKEIFMSPLIHFFSGGTMLCAFFIATDPVTTACTNLGKIIFGFIIACLVWIIRNYSDYPDAISFAVLFANMTVPLIDYYTKTSGYGHNV